MSGSLDRILCVEDESDILEVVKVALEIGGGYRVETCSSGPEALGKAPGFGPDLILLDVMMPGMDGPATLSELQAIDETAHTPVVFMTAKTQPPDVARFRALGAADVIAKPFDPMTLATEVERIWQRRGGADGGS